MKSLEKVLLIIFLLSLIFKYFHGVGSSLLLLLSTNLLAIFYFYFSFALFNNIEFKKIFKKTSYPKFVRKRLAITIFSGFSLSISFIGILFKIEIYPGAVVLLIAGLAATTVLTLITLYRNSKTEGNFFFRILARVAIAAIFIISLLKISDRTLLEWQYPNNPDYIDAVLNSLNNPNNDSLREIKHPEYEKMNEKIEGEINK